MASTVIGYTYRDLIRKYADDVRASRADTDLSQRQRRLTAVVLATASNSFRADVAYPPSAEDRDAVVHAMADRLWDGNLPAFMDAIGPSARVDYGAAVEVAVNILRNL